MYICTCNRNESVNKQIQIQMSLMCYLNACDGILIFFLAKIVYPHILEDPDPGSQNLADPTDP